MSDQDSRRSPSRSVTAPKPIVIACIDDSPPVAEALGGFVSALGFSARTFDSAEALLESVQLSEVTCVIADVQLPRMSGLELHEHLLRSGLRIPVILITGFPDERIRSRAMSLGVVSYLVKPVPKDELVDSIHSALETVG